MSRYTDELEVTAFEKDGQVTVVILNRTGKRIPAYLRVGDQCAELSVKTESVSTAVMESGE